MIKKLAMNEYKVEGEYNLRITSKKLKSGKCQVKFHASIEKKKKLYGYVLAESGETLKNVIEKIMIRLDKVRNRDNFHHINLYSIGGQRAMDSNMIMFDA
ncbi:MAG: hypothetical protein JXR07_01790 [Reichenbachiella sp.]